jgi:hypothetical protein
MPGRFAALRMAASGPRLDSRRSAIEGPVMKRALAVLAALMLSSPLCAARHKPETLIFDEVLGMPIITVQTSQGKRRFVLDTGSSISTMDIERDQELRLSVAGKQFDLRFRPTQTEIFHEFEAALPPTEHVDGILGSDFMRHFHHVSFDFKGCLVSLE